MDPIQKSIKELSEAMKNHEIYQRYLEEERTLNQHPELKHAVDIYRQENYQIQNSEVGEDELFDLSEQLLKKYAELRKNPLVNAYLEAEVEVCQLMKNIHLQISMAVPFWTPWESNHTLREGR
ncbi:MAG TPA: YlbF family regulator [Lachnospiraceae bacterium]|nr:YlbF family regulator [Lachnospiraceae bacterium]